MGARRTSPEARSEIGLGNRGRGLGSVVLKCEVTTDFDSWSGLRSGFSSRNLSYRGLRRAWIGGVDCGEASFVVAGPDDRLRIAR